MICRRPGFLAPAHPHSPLSHQQLVCLAQSSCVSPGEGGEGGRGAESYASEKAWPSINHSILSVFTYIYMPETTGPPPRRKPPSEPLEIKLLARLSLTYTYTYHIGQGIAILGSKNSWSVLIYLDQLSFMLLFFRGKENITHRRNPKKVNCKWNLRQLCACSRSSTFFCHLRICTVSVRPICGFPV